MNRTSVSSIPLQQHFPISEAEPCQYHIVEYNEGIHLIVKSSKIEFVILSHEHIDTADAIMKQIRKERHNDAAPSTVF